MTPQGWSPHQSLDPTPAEARRWLSDELSGSSYHNPWLDSVTRWILDQLARLLDGVNNLTNGGAPTIITVLLAAVVIALLVWVLPKVRRESVVSRPDAAVLGDLTITAHTYRSLAAQAFAQGRYDDAVLEAFRAIAMDMSDRTLLDDAPSRTAHEISEALSLPFPDHADALAQAANVFDAVRYGHRRATADQAGHVRQLDTELAKARPVQATSPLQDLPV